MPWWVKWYGWRMWRHESKRRYTKWRYNRAKQRFARENLPKLIAKLDESGVNYIICTPEDFA